MIAMQIDRSTLQRWLEELARADTYLNSLQSHDNQGWTIEDAQRHVWFVVGQIKSLLTEE